MPIEDLPVPSVLLGARLGNSQLFAFLYLLMCHVPGRAKVREYLSWRISAAAKRIRHSGRNDQRRWLPLTPN